MWLQPLLLQQDGGGGDLFKLLLVLLFFIGPALKRLLDERKKAPGGKPTPQRKPPRPAKRQPQPGQLTWKDLLEGKQPVDQQAPTTWQELLEADAHDEAPAPAPARTEPGERYGSAERVDEEADEDWRPLVPESVLSDVAHEDRLERVGGETEEALLESDDALSVLPASVGRRPLSESAAETTVEGHESRRARSLRLRPRRGDWRRAVVLAEVLGPPLTARASGSHPGPPAGWS